MITFEEAIHIAVDCKPEADYCIETTTAYIFGAANEALNIGGTESLIVFKEDGSTMGNHQYVLS